MSTQSRISVVRIEELIKIYVTARCHILGKILFYFVSYNRHSALIIEYFLGE
jgi:hypothetical protein